MNRNRLVRIQLGLLILLALLMVIRLIAGPPKPNGFLVFVDISDHDLEHDAFKVEKPVRVALDVKGSFKDEVSNELSVYGWIVRRSDRSVVWEMNTGNSVRDGKTLARAQDTLRLDSGIYDAYFTSYGNESGRHEHLWRRDDKKWRFVLNIIGDEEGMVRNLSSRLEQAAPGGDNLLWTSAPTEDDAADEYLFRVDRPTTVRIYALGEMEPNNAMDYGWIEDAASGERRWEMTMSNTEPAGGNATNRRFDGELMLTPGLYRAVYQTDGGHDADNWHTNPPHDPAGWGLSLFTEDLSAFSAFDPWASQQPLISLTKVEDDASVNQSFEVTRPTRVIAYGVGEMTGKGRGNIFDYATLKKQTVRGEEQVWQMSYENSQPAGGAGKNRLEVAFLELDPGLYTLTYVTDGSHSFEDWNSKRPTYPERWGVTLFPMMAADASAIRVAPVAPTAPTSAANGTVPPPAPNAPSLSLATLRQTAEQWEAEGVVNWTQLGKDFNGRFVFELDQPTSLAITALGEHTVRGWHDHGWIEQIPDGGKAWEMTLDNTESAGGDERNRRFDGHIDLPAGAYALRYTTDFSHHYGDFGYDAPENEADWGIRLSRIVQ